MATAEAKASFQLRERASEWGLRLFRNNSGVLKNEVGVPVRFGLGNESKKINQELKSGDFVGWTPVLITQEMVGKQVAIFTNVEAKAEGFVHRETYPKNKREHGQSNFNKMIIKAGGVAGFACNKVEFDNIINDWIKRITK